MVEGISFRISPPSWPSSGENKQEAKNALDSVCAVDELYDRSVADLPVGLRQGVLLRCRVRERER